MRANVSTRYATAPTSGHEGNGLATPVSVSNVVFNRENIVCDRYAMNRKSTEILEISVLFVA